MPTPARLIAILAGLAVVSLSGMPDPGLAEDIRTAPSDTSSVLASPAGLCIKPWTIPDRWDDETLIPGYPEWRYNGLYDQEDFTDRNRNGLFDWGEPYKDENGDGIFNREYYDQLVTGYTAARDHGRLLLLKLNRSANSDGIRAHALVPSVVGHGVPSRSQAYRCCITNSGCGVNPFGAEILMGVMAGVTKQAVRELVAQDPRAEWDDDCECIIKSEFELSPRVGLLSMFVPAASGLDHRRLPPLVKIGGIFVEGVDNLGNVRVRLVKIPTPASAVDWTLPDAALDPQQGPQRRESTWGRIKAERR